MGIKSWMINELRYNTPFKTWTLSGNSTPFSEAAATHLNLIYTYLHTQNKMPSIYDQRLQNYEGLPLSSTVAWYRSRELKVDSGVVQILNTPPLTMIPTPIPRVNYPTYRLGYDYGTEIWRLPSSIGLRNSSLIKLFRQIRGESLDCWW